MEQTHSDSEKCDTYGKNVLGNLEEASCSVSISQTHDN